MPSAPATAATAAAAAVLLSLLSSAVLAAPHDALPTISAVGVERSELSVVDVRRRVVPAAGATSVTMESRTPTPTATTEAAVGRVFHGGGGTGSSIRSYHQVLTVDQSGKAGYTTIQEAVNAAAPRPETDGAVLINVLPGTYSEKLVVNKSRIHLVGKLASSTVVTWKGSWWSDESATAIHVVASDFVARNITFQNTYGEGAPGIAARVDGDRAAFYGCNFLSYQDTILDGDGRHYYQGCYIEGATDFIFGQGKAFFEKCHLHSIAGKDKVGAFTAQGRDAEWKNTGFSFVDCSLTGIGANYTILGRPWRNYARAVFARCTMSNSVRPEGWSDWKKPITHRTAFFGQFQCNGDGSKTNGRVPWAHNDLSAAEAAPYLTKEAWVDGNDWITN